MWSFCLARYELSFCFIFFISWKDIWHFLWQNFNFWWTSQAHVKARTYGEFHLLSSWTGDIYFDFLIDVLYYEMSLLNLFLFTAKKKKNEYLISCFLFITLPFCRRISQNFLVSMILYSSCAVKMVKRISVSFIISNVFDI